MKPMTTLRVSRELSELFDMLDDPSKSRAVRHLDVPHTARLVEHALGPSSNPSLNHLAFKVINNLIISKPEVLYKAGMFEQFYRFLPDPVMLGRLVSSCMAQNQEGAKERDYCPVTIAEYAIELGAVMQWRPGSDIVSSVHDHVLKSMTRISPRHRLMLIRNVVEGYRDLIDQINAEEGRDDEMPYSGYLEEARNTAGQSGLLTVIEQVQVDDPVGLFELLDTHGDDLADMANYGNPFYVIRDIIIKQGKKAGQRRNVAKRCAQLEVLNVMSTSKPGWYKAMMNDEVIQEILIDDICRKGVAEKVCSLPYTSSLDEIFCFEAMTEGLVRTAIDQPTLDWLNTQWKAVGGTGSLADEVSETDRVMEYLEAYEVYVKNLDKVTDPYTDTYPIPTLLKDKDMPEILEKLYINESDRVGATPERRKAHLMHAMRSEDTGMLKWALKISDDELCDREVVKWLCGLSNCMGVLAEIAPAKYVETYSMARQQLQSMIKNPKMRPWLSDITYEVYETLVRDADVDVLKGVRRVNWRDDRIKRDVLEVGMDM